MSDLPVTGERVSETEQATIDDLSNLVMPVVNHPEIKEIGFSVTYLSMDSDPEMYEVRRIWVRTIHDGSRQKSELALWGSDHPTLGHVLFGQSDTDLGRKIDFLWNALRDSRYRNAVLSVFGSGDITVSREGIRVNDTRDWIPSLDDWR